MLVLAIPLPVAKTITLTWTTKLITPSTIPSRTLDTFRMKMGDLRKRDVENMNRAQRQGISIEDAIVLIVLKFKEGSIARR